MQQFRNEDGRGLAASTGEDPAHPPVVLLHGGGQTRHSWNNAFDALVTAGHYVISFDARGHGDSDWDPRGDYTLDAMVADLHAILAHLSSPPALVGASMGGLTALAAASEAIAPIARALVLVDVTPRINAEGAEKIMTFMRSHVQGFESLDEAAQAVTARAPYKPKQIGWIK